MSTLMFEVVVDDASLEAVGFDPETPVKVRVGRHSHATTATSDMWTFDMTRVLSDAPEWVDEMCGPDVVQFWQSGRRNGVAVRIPAGMSGATLQQLLDGIS